MKKTWLFLILLITYLPFLSAQSLSTQLLSTASYQSTQQSSYLNWSVGETFSQTYALPNQQITQGFHQPKYLITTLLAPPLLENTINIKAYPNPTSELLYLSRTNVSKMGIPLTAILVDITGKILLHKIITANTESLNLSHFTQNLYFLSVYQQNGTLLHTFKIQKL